MNEYELEFIEAIRKFYGKVFVNGFEEYLLDAFSFVVSARHFAGFQGSSNHAKLNRLIGEHLVEKDARIGRG